MKKATAQVLLNIGELLIVIGSAFYAVNLILTNVRMMDVKWMLPVIGVIYVLGLIPAVIGKLNMRKYEKAEKAGQEAA